MIQELLGIPGVNFGLAKTKLNEAFTAIQNEHVWSFQLQTAGWLTPGLLGGPSVEFLSPGTITVTPFTNTILGDAAATQAWLGALINPPILTQQQIRVPYYSLYSIIAVASADTVAYLTVDTPGSGQTTGTYIVNAVGTPGSGAQAQIVVNADGEVTETPVVVSQGSGYTSAPTFTLTAGGTPATFTAILNAVLTIDRPWMEPQQVNGTYMVYQAYYAAPAGFKRWYNIRDTTNNNPMDFWSKTQIDLANEDAERTDFDLPLYVVPYGPDTRPGSATYGQMLFELWPHPITQLPYTFGCQTNWPTLVNLSDTLPFPLTDEIVKLRGYEMLYLWKESQKGDEMERGSGANWEFLVGAANAEYRNRLQQLSNMDRNLVDLYFTKMQRFPSAYGEPYATETGQLNVGGWN
jgi:hypothetical protein